MINIIQDMINKHNTFMKYAIIGCSGAFLDFIIFTILIKYVCLNYLIANIISIGVGITNNFFLNSFFNFKITDNMLTRFISFFSIGMLGLFISEGLLYMFIEKLGLNNILSKLVSIFIITMIQYTLNKLITFKKIRKEF